MRHEELAANFLALVESRVRLVCEEGDVRVHLLRFGLHTHELLAVRHLLLAQVVDVKAHVAVVGTDLRSLDSKLRTAADTTRGSRFEVRKEGASIGGHVNGGAIPDTHRVAALLDDAQLTLKAEPNACCLGLAEFFVLDSATYLVSHRFQVSLQVLLEQ